MVTPKRKTTPRADGQRREALRELARIAAFVARRVRAADDPVAPGLQRRLDRDAFGRRFDVARDAVAAHQLRCGRGLVEAGALGVDLQDAALQVVIGKHGRRAKLAQHLA